ncbi:MAG TPA: glycine betaine ABC transporter substrate-binding protein [Myxococcales bacterium LLY-WYZ-16_1]|nr:glycine betaine ABC transporter substrate-binding protein [Myxococcales bacterium LLY-WYZ-16_1]
MTSRILRWLGDGLLLLAGGASFAYLTWLAAPEPRSVPSLPPTSEFESPAVCADEPDGRETNPVRIGWTAWADAEFIAHLVERLIERRMGCAVDLVMADIGIQYQSVAQGDLDAMLMAWLPVTHADYHRRFSDRLVDLGPIYSGAQLGWVVPAYVPKAELSTIADLARPNVRARVGGEIFGIDPGSGLMRASGHALAVYGLSEHWTIVPSSGSAMTAVIERDIRRGNWFVVTAWTPHWMFAQWDLRFLEDPRRALGGPEQVHALVRKDFDLRHPPRIRDMLTRLFIPLPDLEQALLEANRTSVEGAVDRFVAEHPERVRYWLTGRLDSGAAGP